MNQDPEIESPRIPLSPESGLNDQQRTIYDKIASVPRGVVVGPLRAVLHSPELADRWQALGEFLRYGSSLPPRLSELTILVCGRYWNSAVEWYVHAEVGLKAGLPENVIAAIRSARSPAFDRKDEATVYEYSRQMVEFGRVSDDIYQAILAEHGDVGVVELTALIGYYTMVAMTLNAHNVPAPDPNPEPYRRLDDAAAGRDGRTTPLALAVFETLQTI